MSAPNPEIQRLLAQRTLARRHLMDFVQLTYPGYEAGWVHKDICMRLEQFSRDVEMRRSPRLMLLMPPRHGKLLADFTEVYARVDGEECWTTHGALKVGDEVLNRSFKWIPIVAVSRPGIADLEVVFVSGARVVTHRNHEWLIDHYHGRGDTNFRTGRNRGYYPEILSTGQMKAVLDEKGPRSYINTPNKAGVGAMYRFYLPDTNPIGLPMHMWPMIAKRRRRKKGRDCVSEINPTTPYPGKCIQVESHEGVYLVTRDFIPTHNSELASIRLPAWHLGRLPRHEVINVGYNVELPMKFSRTVREIFRSPEFTSIFPKALIDSSSQSVEAWNTTVNGGFTAAGVGGGITGKGCHLLIIDDPLKNMEEADSANRRELLWEWYLSTAYTRLAPGGGVLVIETWWNDDDLAGRLIKAMQNDPGVDQFEVVKYPALSEEFEYRDEATRKIVTFPELQPPTPGLTLLREKDTCLHESRFDTATLKRMRANFTPRIWSALYQQNPVPDEGMYFKKEYIRLVDHLPEPFGLRMVTAWDFAAGVKQANDWTVGATVLQNERDSLYVMDIQRDKSQSLDTVERMLDIAERWMKMCDDYAIVVEDGQIWKSIEPFFRRRAEERRVFCRVIPKNPLTDKAARARPLQGRMEQGRLWFPRWATWLTKCQHELLRFPAGVNDDQVDALSWAVRELLAQAPVVRPGPPQPPSWKDKLDEQSDGSFMAE